MVKRIIAIAIAALMMFSMAAIAASAAEVTDSNVGADSNNSAGADTSSSASGAGDTIKFDASKWAGYTLIYCHIWERGGDSFFPWQSKKELCKKVDGNIFEYDLSTLDKSTTVSGGLQSGKDYCIIFSANTGMQTYDTTFGRACIGDTAKVTGNKIENPVDSEKEAFEAVWTTNSSSYGPHLAISSIGNIIGSKLCPNEKGEEVIGDWIPTYYKSASVNATDALAKAYPKFGITTVDQVETIFGYVQSKNTGEDEDAILKCLTDAFAKAYPAKAKDVKDTSEIKKKAAEKEKAIKSNGGSTAGVSSNSSTGSGSSGSGSSTTGSSGTGSSTGSSSYNSSGSGSDGQEDTILFILGGVMLVAAGAIYMSRKKREE
ncbi:MAG: LPXTG cell wall anchor domain-containing protein [Ruminococcus sp.]|nr:LPXTG cell wall anchor domain-containing protein [Ruminococcus sp.]